MSAREKLGHVYADYEMYLLYDFAIMFVVNIFCKICTKLATCCAWRKWPIPYQWGIVTFQRCYESALQWLTFYRYYEKTAKCLIPFIYFLNNICGYLSNSLNSSRRKMKIKKLKRQLERNKFEILLHKFQ